MSKDIKQPKTEKGKAGELHQLAGDGFVGLTTAQGAAVSDNQNSLRAGVSGPTLLEDFHFREKLFHFDHERIPERVVHARGVGAHGYFETLKSISQLTKAALFQTVGERTPVFARISTVAGNKGSMDLARDVRGFAVKFYTKEGNWDLVGNNMPVFFIQDAIKFPDVIHAVKAAPDRDFPQAQSAHDNFWDYISLTPEAMHMVMWIMSDRAIPRSLRFIEGFGVHSFRFINVENKSSFVKFHWKPKLGMQSVVWNEAVKINGADPDFHRRDLWQSIKTGQYPEWELGVQVFDDEWAKKFEFDILDPTKLIPEELCPVEIIGRMVLDRMPDNFFAETEQVAFCTQNIVPGIDFSDDPLLQGRNFSYLDTQIKRLGSPNFTHLPINAPKCPFHHFQQDGHMAFHTPVGRANYEPNSWGAKDGGPREQKEAGYHSFPQEIGGKKLRERSPSFGDHYSQARQFYISQTKIEQKHIIAALSFELSKCAHLHIRRAMIAHLLNIDTSLAQSVADNIGLESLPAPAETAVPARTDLPPSPALSILKNGPKAFKGRKIGVLLSDAIDSSLLQTIEHIAKKHEVNIERIAMKVGGIVDKDGKKVNVHHQIDGAPSVLFDAILLLIAEPQITAMVKKPAIRDFINDAYAHYKFIGYNDASKPFFAKLDLSARMDDGFMEVNHAADVEKFIASCGDIRFWQRIDAA
ncbi:catalase [Bartonella sp. TP]|uniref:catalase n=1 Tax=Bartonella sp. TP TaxID=3057550 RepID=UPI0025AF1763|nr:catalase [Bartonella sp. TP]WJW80159.1 catalase [Bartonella sp. TP]